MVEVEIGANDVGPLTPDQSAAAWEEEKTWPLWEVILEGDEVEWVARRGQNEDENGVPQPWIAPRVARAQLRAKNEDTARALALNANPDCHTIRSAEKIGEGQ